MLYTYFNYSVYVHLRLMPFRFVFLGLALIQGVRQSTTILTPHLFSAFLEISGSYLVCSKYRWLGLITCTYFGVWCSNSYEQTGLSYTDLENALFFTSAKFLWKIWFILYKYHFEPGTGKTAHIWWFKFEWHHYSFVFWQTHLHQELLILISDRNSVSLACNLKVSKN